MRILSQLSTSKERIEAIPFSSLLDATERLLTQLKDACTSSDYDEDAYPHLFEEEGDADLESAKSDTVLIPSLDLVRSVRHCLQLIFYMVCYVERDLVVSRVPSLIQEIIDFKPTLPNQIIESCAALLECVTRKSQCDDEMTGDILHLVPYAIKISEARHSSSISFQALCTLENLSRGPAWIVRDVYSQKGFMKALKRHIGFGNSHLEFSAQTFLNLTHISTFTDDMTKLDVLDLVKDYAHHLGQCWNNENIVLLSQIFGQLFRYHGAMCLHLGAHHTLLTLALEDSHQDIRDAASAALMWAMRSLPETLFMDLFCAPRFLLWIAIVLEDPDSVNPQDMTELVGKIVDFGNQISTLQRGIQYEDMDSLAPSNPLFDYLYGFIDKIAPRREAQETVSTATKILLQYPAVGRLATINIRLFN